MIKALHFTQRHFRFTSPSLIFILMITSCNHDSSANLDTPKISQATTITQPKLEAIQPIAGLPVSEKKRLFIEKILPAIHKANQTIIIDRERLQVFFSKQEKHTPEEMAWFIDQLTRYRLAPQTPISLNESSLLERVDYIPASLALSQGAIESAWGTSRFVMLGKNYFGIWCFRAGCGIVPANRQEGKTHEVRSFLSATDSVKHYMHNLNSHPAYHKLRMLRKQARDQNVLPSGTELAAGLYSYSALGDDYISSIRATIRSNNFEEYTSF